MVMITYVSYSKLKSHYEEARAREREISNKNLK